MSRDALIVGINAYQHLSALKAPALDAEDIAQRLEQDGEFRVVRLPETIQQRDVKEPVVSGTVSVSQIQLEQALKQLFLPGSKQAPETALFYFSGHGIPDKEGFDKGYLATSDTNPSYSRSGLSLRWLQWLLSESAVKQQIVWLDCCHSGSLIVNVGAANPGNTESRDRCFIASSRDFESSWEDLNSPYSVLTKALLDGLEPTRLPGRWIDTFALVDYVNQALKGKLQTPACTNFGEAINLTKTWQEQKAKTAIIDTNVVCPYKGLSYFEDNNHDHQYFYGRRALTDELLDAVRTSNFVAIVGASGSGKSSVLRAGLLHQLRQGRVPSSDRWDICLMTPGEKPCQALSAAFVDADVDRLERAVQLGKTEALIQEGSDGLRQMVQTAEAERLVLVVDQFEEVFTLCQDDTERQRFFETVLGALATTKNRLCVVLAMRADFVGRCFEQVYSGLAQQVQNHLVAVKPMTVEELTQAMEKPAQRVGFIIEPELVSTLLEDVQNSPGNLPLLQYTLRELWSRRQNETLQLSTYAQLGGVTGTLKQRADEVYDTFTPEKKNTARHIFLNLTQLGEGTEDTRRRVAKSSLVTVKHPAPLIDEVVKCLADANLVVTSELIGKGDSERIAIVDVAHEALIRNWPKLRLWLDENRDLIRQYRKIEVSAEEWLHRNQNDDYLLIGKRLNEAENLFLCQKRALGFLQNAEQIMQENYIFRGDILEEVCSKKEFKVPAIVKDFIDLKYRLDSTKVLRQCENTSVSPSPLIDNYIDKSIARKNKSRFRLLGFGLIFPFIITLYTGLQIAKKIEVQTNWEIVNKAAPNSGINRSVISALQYLNQQNVSFSNQYFPYLNLPGINLSSVKLSGADLHGVNLKSANLFLADFLEANLSGTNLVEADLSNATLIDADLNNADLSNATLHYANLRSADLSYAIILNVDLRTTRGLIQEQIKGDHPPFICNSPLPKGIEIDRNRDCDTLANVLLERYPNGFESLEDAQKFVKEQRPRKLD